MANLDLPDYLNELYDLRDKLRDFSGHVRGGRTSYFKELAIKLRILLCRKSRSEPLLWLIEKHLDLQVVVSVRYSIREAVERGLLPPTLANPAFELTNNAVSWLRYGGDETISIYEALERKEISFDGDLHSYREIIEVAADKMGGAHVDRSIKDRDLSPHSPGLLLGGLPVAQLALLNVSEACIEVIDSLQSAIEHGNQFWFFRARPS